MDINICSYSDQSLTTKVDADDQTPSIFFYPDGHQSAIAQIRIFATREQLIALRDQITVALEKQLEPEALTA